MAEYEFWWLERSSLQLIVETIIIIFFSFSFILQFILLACVRRKGNFLFLSITFDFQPYPIIFTKSFYFANTNIRSTSILFFPQESPYRFWNIISSRCMVKTKKAPCKYMGSIKFRELIHFFMSSKYRFEKEYLQNEIMRDNILKLSIKYFYLIFMWISQHSCSVRIFSICFYISYQCTFMAIFNKEKFFLFHRT